MPHNPVFALKARAARKGCLALAFALLLLARLSVQPVSALSTSREIAQSEKIDREITAQQGLIQDPLLRAWVARLAARVWKHAKRTDLPYSVKILDSQEVNAFTTGGGFIYLDEGVLDVVGSDDELAGVIGHETGHDEFRHPIMLHQRGELLSLIFGLATILSPALGGLGSFISEGFMAHSSRNDEYQADAEGLQFLIKADLNPHAMVSLLHRLVQLEGNADTHIDQYLADHPGLSQRIGRLQQSNAIQQLDHASKVQENIALRNEQAGHYALARSGFQHILAAQPKNAFAALHLGRLEAILGQPARADQHLQAALSSSEPLIRSNAAGGLDQLHENERIQGAFPQVPSLTTREQIISLRRSTLQNAQLATITREHARATLAAIATRLQQMSANSPTLDGQNGTEPANHALENLGRIINTIIDRGSIVIDGVGSLERGKESGLWSDALALDRDIASRIALDAPPPEERALLMWYPQIEENLRSTNRDLQTSLDQAYQALLRLNRGLDIMAQVFTSIESLQAHGTVSSHTLDTDSSMQAANLALNSVLNQALKATQAYNRARSRQLIVRLTLLHLDTFPDRRRSLMHALSEQLALPEESARQSFQTTSAGEYAAASILAADAKTSPERLLREAKARGLSVVDLPDVTSLDTQALEIMLGLIYLDYTDDAEVADKLKTGSSS